VATTAQQVFDWTMDLIDERLNTGLISASDTISYNVKSPGILTLLQTELIKQGDVYSTYSISNYPVNNLLGQRSNFDIRPFEGTELTFVADGSAKAYYFEVDDDATVYVEDFNGAWNTLQTVNAAPTASGFTAYKGIVTPSSGAYKSRLRFGGTYYYRTVNRALFGVSFASASDVPDYRAWILKQMPSDFKSVDEIIQESVDEYAINASYKWEGKRDLYMDYYFQGNLRIVYRPIPAVITALSDTLVLDDVTARMVLPFGLAAHLMLEENAATASYFNQRYEELKRQATKGPPSPTEKITDLYGGL
jgi:hypothetical protein